MNDIAIEMQRLENTLASFERQMDAEGVEDATDWEHWDEYESALYKLAELETMFPELAEYVAFVEDAVLAEL